MSLVHYGGTVAAAFWVGLCLWDAERSEDYAFLAAGFGWGFLIEFISMETFEGYHYALESFAVSLEIVPLQIMLMWAAILYTGYKTGRYMGLDANRLPFFVALYGLHIDIAIDGIAAEIPYWVWENGGRWFGVPINNYVGWYTVAVVFVAVFVVMDRYVHNDANRALVTLPVTSVVFFVGMALHGFLTGPSRVAQTIALVAYAVVSLGIVASGDAHYRRTSVPLAAVTVTIHLFFIAVGAMRGMFADTPALLMVCLAMLGVGVAIHAGPYWLGSRTPEPARA